MFSLVSDIALSVASVLAGGLWRAFGPQATFLIGPACAGVALLGLVVLHPLGPAQTQPSASVAPILPGTKPVQGSLI